MQDESIYRCINPACARAMPRPVHFCPWCGTAQDTAARTLAEQRGAEAEAEANADAEAEAEADARRAALAAAGAAAAASVSGWSDAPADLPEPAPPAPPPAPEAPTAPPSAHAFGHGGKEAPRAAPRPGASAGPATPRQREPIRLRWWILALALMWGVWLVAKPSARKTERRIENAVELARECKGKDAQDELIALRAARATPVQLERLQKALNEEAGKCTRRRQRDKAWSEAQDAAQAALKAGNAERARSRLQAFVKRFGDDKDTRALAERIEAARGDHPLAAPEAASAAESGGDVQSARNLVREARADLARGAFNAAADKMALCLGMVDPGNRECAALKAQAEREGKMQ